MKNYNVKYEVDQEVYFLNNKSIFKSKIDKIRITEQRPYTLVNAQQGHIEDAENGLTIEYLVAVKVENYGTTGSVMIGYDWYNQRDVFSDKDELIARIK